MTAQFTVFEGVIIIRGRAEGEEQTVVALGTISSATLRENVPDNYKCV